MQRGLVIVLIAVWLGLGIDALRIAMTEATGDGFTRGLDRAQGVLLRQVAAALVAAAAWWLGRQLDPGWLRRLSMAPLVATGLLALVVVARVLLAVA